MSPTLPDLDGVEDMLREALFKMGTIRHTDMGGERPLDWPEVLSFARATAYVSEPWEIEALHDMSASYVRGLIGGRSPFGIEPVDRD